jgi:hypothetical protein
MSAWIDKYRINPQTPIQLIDFRKDVAGRGYNIGGKKLINVFCSERISIIIYIISVGV